MVVSSQIPNFRGLGVAGFESRRSQELAALIQKYGGVPYIGPSVREVPLESNRAIFDFGEKLLAGKIDAVIFTTGVGTRGLLDVLHAKHSRARVVEALTNVTTVSRGAKPAGVLRELGVPITMMVPEPNTWREILQEIDENPRSFALEGRCVAVQEYGLPNAEFLEALKSRGAEVLPVPVYRWALPEDLDPLIRTLQAIVDSHARVLLFTNGVQVDHALKVADDKKLRDPLLKAMERCLIGSVGPTCTEALHRHGLGADLEASPPKMGVLVLQAAREAERTLEKKVSASTSLEKPIISVVASTGSEKEEDILSLRDSLFMKACRREPTSRTPVWLMRQVGRFMKEYRDLRAKLPFLKLCKDPDLVAELTSGAARKLGVDAAIIFADLLLIVESLGFELQYDQGDGPSIAPVIRQVPDVSKLLKSEPRGSLDYLFQAIRKTSAELHPSLPLIGFAAAPFTLASYLIEGGASRTFRHTKALMYRDAGAWKDLMTRLADALAEYANAQIEAGVDAVQIFDSWVGCLSPQDYRQYVLPYSKRMIEAIKPGTPVIHFGLGTGQFLEDMRKAGGNIIGLDFHVDLEDAWRRVGFDVAVQGNLDPAVLYADRPLIRARVKQVLDQAGGRPGHIFNLGHGVLPDTPEENVMALVEMVHDLSDLSKL